MAILGLSKVFDNLCRLRFEARRCGKKSVRAQIIAIY